ncbi:MAG TPA: small ribosomal subunit Rsm22 family protein [Polyangia bacterium]|nr:small ribosomal subunit Rsm22 family protein [Polyangia bacterium]
MAPPKARGRRGSAIHDGLVGARKLVGTPYLADAELRGEYAREIAPRTEAALGRVLGDPSVLGAPPRRALDLGAGTGAVGRALRARFGDAFELREVDRTAGSGQRPGQQMVRADLAVELPPVAGKFDLVVAAHLLNELFVGRSERIALRAQRVLAWADALVAPGGRLLLLEPALRQTSRDLLAVRDQVLRAGLHVVAPCFFAGPCPALARERDWCHDAAPVPSQPRVDFSYLVLAREPVPPRPLHRVVSDPLPEKGRLRLFVCGPDGRHQLIRLTRHRGASNEVLDAVARGDALSIQNATAGDDGVRVTAETTVDRPT